MLKDRTETLLLIAATVVFVLTLNHFIGERLASKPDVTLPVLVKQADRVTMHKISHFCEH